MGDNVHATDVTNGRCHREADAFEADAEFVPAAIERAAVGFPVRNADFPFVIRTRVHNVTET